MSEKIESLSCPECGAPISFPEGATQVQCQLCNSIIQRTQSEAQTKKLMEEGLLKLAELLDTSTEAIHKRIVRFEDQVKKGVIDTVARSEQFKRFIQPALQSLVELELEHHPLFLSSPLIHFDSLALVDEHFSVTNTFPKGTWTLQNGAELLNISRYQLGSEYIEYFIAGDAVNVMYIKKLQTLIELTVWIYNARGKTIDKASENLKLASKFFETVNEKALEVAEYSNKTEKIKFEYIAKRMQIIGHITNILAKCLNNEEFDVRAELTAAEDRLNDLITELENPELGLEALDSIPLKTGIARDNLSIQLIDNTLTICEKTKGKMTFGESLTALENYVKFVLTIPDSQMQIDQRKWDANWLKKAIPMEDRISELLNRLIEHFKAFQGEKALQFTRTDFNWVNGMIKGDLQVNGVINIEDKNLREYVDWLGFKGGDDKLISEIHFIYTPLYLLSTYGVIKTGGIASKIFRWLKAGEDVEKFVVVNGLFSKDMDVINNGAYYKSITELTFTVNPEKDKQDQYFTQISEKDFVSLPNARLIPPTALPSEAEELVLRTYDFFDQFDINTEAYKKKGFNENILRIKGEVTATPYTPCIFLRVTDGKMKEKGWEASSREYYLPIYEIWTNPAWKDEDVEDFAEVSAGIFKSLVNVMTPFWQALS